jgi:hypothetical protein
MELILLWLLGLLSIFSSVGSADYSESSEPVPSASASPALDPLQEQFRARSRLASCGRYEVEHGVFEEVAQPGWQCLQDAASTQGAEARFSTAPIGAAPVDTYVRVFDGVMEIYVNDPSADPFAAWTYDTCSVEQASFRQGCP